MKENQLNSFTCIIVAASRSLTQNIFSYIFCVVAQCVDIFMSFDDNLLMIEFPQALLVPNFDL